MLLSGFKGSWSYYWNESYWKSLVIGFLFMVFAGPVLLIIFLGEVVPFLNNLF